MVTKTAEFPVLAAPRLDPIPYLRADEEDRIQAIFDAKRPSWPKWYFQVGASTKSIHPDVKKLMDWVKEVLCFSLAWP